MRHLELIYVKKIMSSSIRTIIS